MTIPNCCRGDNWLSGAEEDGDTGDARAYEDEVEEDEAEDDGENGKAGPLLAARRC